MNEEPTILEKLDKALKEFARLHYTSPINLPTEIAATTAVFNGAMKKLSDVLTPRGMTVEDFDGGMAGRVIRDTSSAKDRLLVAILENTGSVRAAPYPTEYGSGNHFKLNVRGFSKEELEDELVDFVAENLLPVIEAENARRKK